MRKWLIFACCNLIGAISTVGAMNTMEFTRQEFMAPESLYWPSYFWLWNGPLHAEVITEQLQDMRNHDARSVCILPMPREFRPDRSNNQMDVDYLSDEFFQRIEAAVREANRLDMQCILYDEGGWPSGQAGGRVTRDHPEFQSAVMKQGEDGQWRLESRNSVDRLNPLATQRFLELTHQGYSRAVGHYLGNTIRLMWTDEPTGGRFCPPCREVPWTAGLGEEFEQKYGYRIEEHLDIFAKDQAQLTPDEIRIKIDFYDCWSQRFVDAYYTPIHQWCREHHIWGPLTQPDNEHTTDSPIEQNGNILRVMRSGVPSIDVIWRQIWPMQKNHHFPLYAASAAHQLGLPWAHSESFCVYGNGLTLEQMKWIIDYQYVRGINLLTLGCYPLSTRDHLMGGERPHFGPVNPLWDLMPGLHGYIARLGYALSCGKPLIETALYYPVRDLWAYSGCKAIETVITGHDSLAGALLKNQCGFDLVDDDVLSEGATVKDGRLCIGPMQYRTLVFGPCRWLKEDSTKILVEFIRSGGEIFCLEGLPGTNGDHGERLTAILDESAKMRIHRFHAAEEISLPPGVLASFEPPCPGLRILVRKMDNGSLYFLWNEGDVDIDTMGHFQESGTVCELDPQCGKITSVEENLSSTRGETVLAVHLRPGESRLLLFGYDWAEENRLWQELTAVKLTQGWQVKILRRFDVGTRNYEVSSVLQNEWEPAELGSWVKYFSEDFSGDAVYRITVPMRKEQIGASMKLELGRVEYAARVRINGKEVGSVSWSPWELSIPGKIETDRLELEIVVTNTLANVLTSQQVREDWKSRTGPGWPPAPYDLRAADLEKESRGGGLYGPVILKIGKLEH